MAEEDPLPFLDELAPLPGQVCPFIPAQPTLVEQAFRGIDFDASKDYVVDLDGRILLCIAKNFKLRGIGIDINADLLAKAKAEAKAENLDALVNFLFASFTDPLFSLWKLPGPRLANIVAIYLIPEATAFFRTHLTQYIKEQANVGVRVHVISLAFRLYDWKPILTGPSHNYYIYDPTSIPE